MAACHAARGSLRRTSLSLFNISVSARGADTQILDVGPLGLNKTVCAARVVTSESDVVRARAPVSPAGMGTKTLRRYTKLSLVLAAAALLFHLTRHPLVRPRHSSDTF